MINNSAEDVFESLTHEEKSAVTMWREKRCILVRKRVQEEVEAELETDTTVLRESIPFIRVRVHSVDQSTSKCEEGLLTIWEPTEEQLSLLKEGTAVEIQSLAVRETGYDGLLQLTASSRTLMESFDLEDSSLVEPLGYEKRRFLNLFQVHAKAHKLQADDAELRKRWPDFDTVGLQVKLVKPPSGCKKGFQICVTDETHLMLRIHCDFLPFGFEKALSKRIGRVKHDCLFRVFAFCDLRLLPFDHEENCAVARFCDTSSLAKATTRIEALQRWASVSQGHPIRRMSTYLHTKLPLSEGNGFMTAVGYIVGLKAVCRERLNIEVDCGCTVEEWEFPVRLLEAMLPIVTKFPAVSLLPEEEGRIAGLGVLGRVFRARGILWRFELRSILNSVASTPGYVVTHISEADKRALGSLYEMLH
jgi:hypothetical protein